MKEQSNIIAAKIENTTGAFDREESRKNYSSVKEEHQETVSDVKDGEIRRVTEKNI